MIDELVEHLSQCANAIRLGDLDWVRFARNVDGIDVRYGCGEIAKLHPAMADLGLERAIFVGTKSAPARYAKIIDSLGDRLVAVFDEALPHCPVETVESLRARYRDSQADGVIAIGGGSTLGLGKIMAAEEEAKFIAVPTTYSGSEMTSIFGRLDKGEKKTRVDSACLPSAVFYDPELTVDLPVSVTLESAMNSLAHSVESIFVEKPHASTHGLAAIGIEGLIAALPKIVDDPSDLQARALAQLSAFIGGRLIALNGISVHHQLCHVIGGRYELPHGVSNSAVLPHAVAYMSGIRSECDRFLCDVLGSRAPAVSLMSFVKSVGAPFCLKDYGVPANDAPSMAQALIDKGFYCCRPLEKTGLVDMIEGVISGHQPRAYSAASSS